MTEILRRVLDTGPPAWTGLGRPLQIALGALLLGLPLALFAASQVWTGDTHYVPLFASLPAEDAGAIVGQLKTAKTPYRIGPAGEILVPPDKAGELRLRMAVQGLPLGGGVGFEVFDKTAFGLSDFNQRVNYQRALQGELARSIGQLRGVQRARVHLVMPQPSLFADRERQPSASIFLKLVPGGRLSGEETRGIVHLVASSVEGLAPERVTMVDTAGRVLAAGSEGGTSHLSPRRLEIKSAVEEGIERRVQSLLDSALGPGQAVTRASAQLNFDQVERTEERFDPKPVTRQESRTIETAKGLSAAPSMPSGTPTPGSSLLGAANTTNEGSRESATSRASWPGR
jgi:flagellar M-ring protein FliF